jgi:Organic solute transporter Ostalpha
MIFQYPVVATLAAIAADVTQAAGVYCEYVSKPYFARLWVSGDKQIFDTSLNKLTLS